MPDKGSQRDERSGGLGIRGETGGHLVFIPTGFCYLPCRNSIHGHFRQFFSQLEIVPISIIHGFSRPSWRLMGQGWVVFRLVPAPSGATIAGSISISQQNQKRKLSPPPSGRLPESVASPRSFCKSISALRKRLPSWSATKRLIIWN